MSEATPILVLDGPMGTELDRRGVPTPLPLWSAGANASAPEVVEAIHRDYAHAGATLHTANTFRTKRRTVGERWRELARLAMRHARAAAPPGHRVLGSIAPLEDCYRPDRSPAEVDPEATRREHAELARALVEDGADVLLIETFPHAGEALIALDVALATGTPSWLSLTPGPDGSLMAPAALAEIAGEAARRGAGAILVNCVASERARAYVEALADVAARVGVPFGVYANAGHVDDEVGWRALDEDPSRAADRYASSARRWIASGATIVGSCCGTGVPHIRALAELARERGGRVDQGPS
ncbi:MAG: homocysteine S-methyltransferase family protein [Sandaracinaceae bacterium]|nr:homocysteine S-methyltransferase family protein [Sandaracinaceae bacterium]